MLLGYLFQVGIPIKFWGDAVPTEAHSINKAISKVIDNYTPYHCLSKSKKYVNCI